MILSYFGQFGIEDADSFKQIAMKRAGAVTSIRAYYELLDGIDFCQSKLSQ